MFKILTLEDKLQNERSTRLAAQAKSQELEELMLKVLTDEPDETKREILIEKLELQGKNAKYQLLEQKIIQLENKLDTKVLQLEKQIEKPILQPKK